MRIKIMLLFLMLLALSWPVSSVECINLGNGASDQVINLNAGARQPAYVYSFGRAGFVAPQMPQTIALSPNAMLAEAQELNDEAQDARDEAVLARDEAKNSYEQAQAARDEAVLARDEVKSSYELVQAARDEAVLARDEAKSSYELAQATVSRIEKIEKHVNDLAKDVQDGSDSCAVYADKCSDILSLTNDTYRKNLDISSALERNISQMREDLQEARSYADASALNAAYAADCLNRTLLVYNETLDTSESIADMLNDTKKISDAKSDAESGMLLTNQTEP